MTVDVWRSSTVRANSNPSVYEEGHAVAILAAFNLGGIYKDAESIRFEGQAHFPFEWIALTPINLRNACITQRGRRFLKLREKSWLASSDNAWSHEGIYVYLPLLKLVPPVPSIEMDAYSGRT